MCPLLQSLHILISDNPLWFYEYITTKIIANFILGYYKTGCPKELQVVGGGEGGGQVVACKSACEAFGLDQYCCSGEFANPNTCKPSFYSTIFKRACPRAYSYAFDDGTSTFTCKAYDYQILFCPNSQTQRYLLISYIYKTFEWKYRDSNYYILISRQEIFLCKKHNNIVIYFLTLCWKCSFNFLFFILLILQELMQAGK